MGAESSNNGHPTSVSELLAGLLTPLEHVVLGDDETMDQDLLNKDFHTSELSSSFCSRMSKHSNKLQEIRSMKKKDFQLLNYFVCIVLSEISQTENSNYLMTSLTCVI